jgi:hypothetical protein
MMSNIKHTQLLIQYKGLLMINLTRLREGQTQEETLQMKRILHEQHAIRETTEKTMDDYTDDEWDDLTEAEQDAIRKASKKDKGGNPSTGPGHNKYEESTKKLTQQPEPVPLHHIRQLLEEAGYNLTDEATASGIQKAKRLLEQAGYTVEEPDDDDE